MATPIPANRAPLSTWSAAAATGGTVARVGGEGADAVGVTTDSRAVVEGGAFVALRGGVHDGHDYLAEAAKRGAALVVVARGHAAAVPAGIDVVEVDDTLQALGAIAEAHLRAWRRLRRAEPARVIAITGSAGKTTTKELCAALLGAVVGGLVVGSVVANSQPPVYVQQPVYVQPQPVYIQQPPPVYYQAPPPPPGYYYQPQPVPMR